MVLRKFSAGFILGLLGLRVGFRSPQPLPAQPSCEARALLMLRIDRHVQKNLCGIFLGLEGPALSSSLEDGPKWVPNCADDVPVRGGRARASYRSIISTIGNPFLPNWDQGGQKTKKSYQSTKAAGAACR